MKSWKIKAEIENDQIVLKRIYHVTREELIDEYAKIILFERIQSNKINNLSKELRKMQEANKSNLSKEIKQQMKLEDNIKELRNQIMGNQSQLMENDKFKSELINALNEIGINIEKEFKLKQKEIEHEDTGTKTA